jgi:hypothetical protein
MTTDPDSIKQFCADLANGILCYQHVNPLDAPYLQIMLAHAVNAGIAAERERCEASMAEHRRMLEGYHAELDRQNAAGGRKTSGKIV